MGVDTASLIVAAFVNGALAIAALLRNIRSKLCVSFACFLLCLFCHDVLSVLQKFQPWHWAYSTVAHTAFIVLAGPATLWVLGEVIVSRRAFLHRILWVYVPICLLFLVGMALPGMEPSGPLLLLVANLLYLFPAGLWLTALGQAADRSRLARDRIRLRYAFLGGCLTGILFLTDVGSLLGGNVAPLGTLASTLYLFFVFQTFIQKELMTAQEALAKFALFAGVALMLSTIFLVLVSWVGHQHDLLVFNTVIASLVIVVLFEPIRQFTVWGTRKLFLRKNHLIEQELASLSESLRGVVEPSDLARRLSRSLPRAIRCEKMALYTMEKEGLAFIRLDSQGNRVGTEEESATGSLAEYMGLRRGKPFVLESIENDKESFHSPGARKFCEDCLESLRKLDGDFVLPFVFEEKIFGFAILKSAEASLLSNEQLRLFVPVSRQIALVLKNAESLGALSKRNKLAVVGEMAAGLAHEIKNPLGAIKGAAELLWGQEFAKDENAQGFLKIILQESDRLSKVLTGFLDYAKPRKSAPEHGCNPVRVAEHVVAVVLQKEILSRIEIEAPEDIPKVSADPDCLKQVLLNMVLNGVDSMKPLEKGGKVKIRFRGHRPRGRQSFTDELPFFKILEGWQALKSPVQKGMVEVEIIDEGSGIAESDLDKVFTPFFTTKADGTGLGLAICQRLVEEMNGSIFVKPNRTRGTTFTLHLPLFVEAGEVRRSVAMEASFA